MQPNLKIFAHSCRLWWLPKLTYSKQNRWKDTGPIQRLSYRDALATAKNAHNSTVSSNRHATQLYALNPPHSPPIPTSPSSAYGPPQQSSQHMQQPHPSNTPPPIACQSIAVQTNLCNHASESKLISRTPDCPQPICLFLTSNTQMSQTATVLIVSVLQLKSDSHPKQINEVVKSIMGIELTSQEMNVAFDQNNNMNLQMEHTEEIKSQGPLPEPSNSDLNMSKAASQPHTSVAESVKVRHKKTHSGKQAPTSHSPRNLSRRKPNNKS